MHWLESLRMCLCNMIEQLWLRRESHFIQPCLCLCNHYFLLEACAWWTDNEGHYNSAVKLHNNQLKCRKRAWNLPGSHYHCLSICPSSLLISPERCVFLCVCLCLLISERSPALLWGVWPWCHEYSWACTICQLVARHCVIFISLCVISLALVWRGLICNYVVRCHEASAMRRIRMGPGLKDIVRTRWRQFATLVETFFYFLDWCICENVEQEVIRYILRGHIISSWSWILLDL